jgi:hypothetical protein
MDIIKIIAIRIIFLFLDNVINKKIKDKKNKKTELLSALI